MLYDPRPDQLIVSAARRGLTLSAEEAESLIEVGRETLRGCERVDRETRFTLPLRQARVPGHQPGSSDNRFGAWAWNCDIAGTDGGALEGKTVVLKDVIPVAGQPLTAGSAVLAGHVSSFDATVTTRVLDSGGRIVGIAATEDMCLSGVSVSAASGPIHNPRDPQRSAGGSSSGVAALVAAGSVDVGIGADQGGSIRIPASLCGVYGMKPTYGLVPYTGCLPIDPSLDHLGPIAGSVEDTARLLQAIAGYDDGLDPRQDVGREVPDYLAAIADADPAGLRIGMLKEGSGHPGLSDPGVDETVLEAVDRLRAMGASVSEVHVPLHRRAMDIHGSLLLQGAAQYMVGGSGVAPMGKGFYNETAGNAVAAGMALRGDQLFASVKFATAIGGYLWDAHGGAYYAKAQNLALSLRHVVDAALDQVDVLVMPTTCVQAPPLPPAGAPGLEAVRLALDPALISNTCGFNHTGHPALSVPLPGPGDLPVGLMLVGRWFDEQALLRVARLLESTGATLRPTSPALRSRAASNT